MKIQTMERNFRKLKNELSQTENIVRHSKTNSLWEHEASVRKKIKTLKNLENSSLKDYSKVYEGYLELLDYISIRLIEDYNRKNHTHFFFDEIVRDNYDAYLQSGIMSVLIVSHLPKVISKEFERVFPLNPKDEYREARNIKRKIYLHLGETNTGKTYNAMKKLMEADSGVYLSPLRILALENYERLNREGVRCNLVTGEEEIKIEGALHTCCTIEKLNLGANYQVAVIDEIQMINDDQRGAAWTRAILGLKCSEIHVCGAANSKTLLQKILNDCNDEYEIVEYKRNIPLTLEEKAFYLKDICEGDALVVFSKKRVLELAAYYSDLGIKASLIYGDLPPEVRRKQYELFIDKVNGILISTDAIGMGVNLPIRRIIFMDIKKFDGNEVRYLTSQEVKQIAGRAGRKGIYDEGYVNCYGENHDFITENLEIEDAVIEKGVLGPSEDILSITQLSLREKLALWSTKEEKIPWYRKMDISEFLFILDLIKGYKLDERVQWMLLRIPFDISNQDIINKFLSYVDEHFIAKRDVISKPQCLVEELEQYETYYQKINLYYSFSRTFNLEFDENWVYNERVRVSERINNLLMKL